MAYQKMKQAFKKLNNCYKSNDFEGIFTHKLGTYFLKMRSVSRPAILRQIAELAGIKIDRIKGKQLFEFMFCQNVDRNLLDNLINKLYEEERNERIRNEDALYTQLFRLPVFYWGGFYQNAVEQTIVNNYIKKIQDYEELLNKIEIDINPRLKGYILCSWYNHWTSILIEDIFKDHRTILPVVGLVKKVDFFWNDFPFDLKVTYFPDGFMKDKRKEMGLPRELTELKRMARTLKIPIDNDLSDNELFTELLKRITENTAKESKEFVMEFHERRKNIINETINNPEELIRWFYENQGTRRFDAANRFFVVLIDRNNMEESWKLKRNKELLEGEINKYLDNNQDINFDNFKINFHWDGNDFITYATCLFIIKE